jgi:hypothetical protein
MGMESRRHRLGGVGACAIAAVLLVLASGCGGDSSGSASHNETEPEHRQALTRSELIAKADAICVASRRALRRLTARTFRQTRFPNPSERLPNVLYSEEVLELSEKTVRQLKALTPPSALRSAYEAYVGAHEEIESLDEQALQASFDDDGGAYLKARKVRDAGFLDRAELAEAVGLKKCSPNPFY